MAMRTERATVKGHTYSILRAEGKALVSSKSDGDAWHAVKCGRCDCAWAQKSASNKPCAHVLALQSLELQAAIVAAEAEAAAVEARIRNLREGLEELAGSPAKALPAATACQPSRTAARATLARLPQAVKDGIL